MAEEQINYTDGAAYERTVGKWSQLAGEIFIEWLAPSPNLSWIDVGCGSGAFTELLVQRCALRSITGVDPAEAQIVYGRSRPAGCRRIEISDRRPDLRHLPAAPYSSMLPNL